ncbi:MAG: penicillin-binding transpeptidase domain-containing protein [Tepidanaerobacteraceae bacterium]|jgi:peptidoglycan glycosyltransferase|nr:penicillin-binding transpeptidase domain-containing protein [Tepidanaerobacteraceae bacterium]
MDRLKKNTKIIFGIFCGLFVSLIIYLSYFTAYERDRLIQSSYNRRLWEQEDKVLRGTIYDARGRPLADTVIEGNVKKRIYPGGEAFGPLIGYSDRRFGRAGLEDALNGELLGVTEKDPMVLLRQKILGVADRGNDVYLTIDSQLQSTAYSLFRGRRGALAALDPNTGAVLALVSSPGYDASNLQNKWDGLLNNPDKPLINRATQGLYPPGSAFKIITLAAALCSHPEIEKKIYYTPGYVKINGRIIRDYENLWPGDYDLNTAFRYSSNTVFIQIGQEAGADNLFSMAEAFGFNANLDTDIPVATSTMPRPPSLGGDVELAEDSIGQGKILATPLQMARVALVIASGGRLVTPYVIQKIVTPLGLEKSMHKAEAPRIVLEKTVADKIKALMVDVVKSGTGKPANINGITVAGKTGSAENPHGKTHAWFVGFAPAEDPKIAVAAVVENAGGGGANAGPIVREVMLKYLNSLQNK